MKRVLALLTVVLAFASTAARAADSTTITGYISDAMCGAKHAGTGAACAKKCIEGGEAPVFVDEAKKEVWTATADSSKKSVHIDTIAEAK
jgi:hypothetical protein